MIENIRERIDKIDAHLDKADDELMGVLSSMEVPDVQESNLDVFKRLGDTLNETLITLSAMATHYQTALEHRRTAQEAITGSGVSTETELGRKILGAVSRGLETIDRVAGADTNEIGLGNRLEGFKYQRIAYENLERTKVRADDTVRRSVGSCSNSIQLATNTTTDLKKVL